MEYVDQVLQIISSIINHNIYLRDNIINENGISFLKQSIKILPHIYNFHFFFKCELKFPKDQ